MGEFARGEGRVEMMSIQYSIMKFSTNFKLKKYKFLKM